MKKGNKKIFNNKELLYELINLRLNGWAYTSLGIHFNCDRKAVEKQCKKYDIDKATENIFNIGRIVSQYTPKIEDRFINLGSHRICKGKDYKDYYSHSNKVNYYLQ